MQRRSHVIVLLIPLIGFVPVTIAQNFAPGYYVKTGGDTVNTKVFAKEKRGFILGLMAEDGQTFSAPDITAMGIGNTNYIVRTVSIDQSPNGAVVSKIVFLEVISRGKISLLTMMDENEKAHFYIQDEDESITELVLKVLDRGDGITFQELPVYKQTLRTLFPTCNNQFPAIEKTRYNRTSIRSIYERLYECRYGDVPVMASTKAFITDGGLMLGLSSTNLSFQQYGGFTAIAPQLTFDKSTDLTGGIFIESKFSRTSSLFTIRNELTHRRYNASSQDLYGGQGQTHLFGYVSANYIKYNLVLRATFSHSNLKPFINIGTSPAYLIASSNHALLYSGPTQGRQDLLGRVKRFEFGYFGGAGLRFNNFSVEARLEKSNGLQPEYCNSTVSTLYVVLSYQLLAGFY